MPIKTTELWEGNPMGGSQLPQAGGQFRILLVSNSGAPFVENDRRILSESGACDLLIYRGRIDLPRLLAMILRADLVVCWFVLGYATTATLIGLLARIPTLLVAGGWDVVGLDEIGYGAMLSPARTRKTRFALRTATSVTAVSQATRNEVLHWTNREVSVIRNGVDLEIFCPNDEPRLRQVVTVAGVDSEVRFQVKGVQFLIDIAERLSDVPFVVVGKNSAAWSERLTRLSPANVRFESYVNRFALRDIFRSSRVYLQPSRYESFGMSLAEAMACGCYPVATEVGGPTEVVGQTGSLVPYGDVDAAANAILAGLERATCSEASERIAEQFSLEERRKRLSAEVEHLLRKR